LKSIFKIFLHLVTCGITNNSLFRSICCYCRCWLIWSLWEDNFNSSLFNSC